MKLPNPTKRTIVLGRTGSGKTVFAVGLLSTQNYKYMPWVIFDFKGDELIQKLQDNFNVPTIDINKKPPKKAGLYIVRPLPIIDDDAVEQFLLECWRQQNIGIYIDEGYCIPNNSKALTVVLTQGRARRVPVIALYQRPVYMARHAIAQADYFAVFDQNDERDLLTTQSFIKSVRLNDGRSISVFTELPKYWAIWYDVSEGKSELLRPCPTEDAILANFAKRLKTKPKRKFI